MRTSLAKIKQILILENDREIPSVWTQIFSNLDSLKLLQIPFLYKTYLA